MTLVDGETGEIVSLTKAEALDLTAKIKAYVGQAWRLLAIAYRREAHYVLGFPTWEAYVEAEFGVSRATSYRMLDRAFVIGEIEEAAGLVDEVPGDVSRARDIELSERAAADLKPHIALVTERVREAVVKVTPERVAEVVTATVRQVREEVVRRRDDADAVRDLAERHAPEGWDANAKAKDAAQMEERAAAIRAMKHLASMRDAGAFLDDQPEYVDRARFAVARDAHVWLTDLLDHLEDS